MRSTRRLNETSDEGAALIMAIIVITVVALLALAVLGYASTTTSRMIATREKVERVLAANSGIRYAVRQIENAPESCSGASNSWNPVVNGYDVQVRCYFGAGIPSGRNTYAIVITTDRPDHIRNSGSLRTKVVEQGPVFFTNAPPDPDPNVWSGPPNNPGQSSYLQVGKGGSPVVGGNVVVEKCASMTQPWWLKGSAADGSFEDPYRYEPCTGTPWYEELRPVAESVPGGAACTTSPLGLCLPARPPNGSVADPSPSCRVFSPGSYGTGFTAFSLLQGGNNFFRSGIYYFNNVAIDVASPNTRLVGGSRNESGVFQDSILDIDTSWSCAGLENDSGNGDGVTLIMGGSSRILLHASNTTAIELYKRVPLNALEEYGTRDATVIAVTNGYRDGAIPSGLIDIDPTDDTGPSAYNPSTMTQSWNHTAGDCGGCIVAVDSGNNPKFAVNGLIYAPNTNVEIANVAGAQEAAFRGGIVAAGIEVQATTGTTGLSFSGHTSTIFSRLYVVSTALGKAGQGNVVARAEFDVDSDSTGRLFTALHSWVVD